MFARFQNVRTGLQSIRRDLVAGHVPSCPWKPHQTWYAKSATAAGFVTMGVGAGIVSVYSMAKLGEVFCVTCLFPAFGMGEKLYRLANEKAQDYSERTQRRWLGVEKSLLTPEAFAALQQQRSADASEAWKAQRERERREQEEIRAEARRLSVHKSDAEVWYRSWHSPATVSWPVISWLALKRSMVVYSKSLQATTWCHQGRHLAWIPMYWTVGAGGVVLTLLNGHAVGCKIKHARSYPISGMEMAAAYEEHANIVKSAKQSVNDYKRKLW
jgi:hypothetical protein